MSKFKKGDMVTTSAYANDDRVKFIYIQHNPEDPDRSHKVLRLQDSEVEYDYFSSSCVLLDDSLAPPKHTFSNDSTSEDMVNHPTHYTSDPSGVECIQITRHRNFNVGNAIKYLWRNGLKEDASKEVTAKQVEDLEKAIFYIKDEIDRLQEAK